jgi:membrane fusion protein, multidrug efflux system
MKTTRISLTRTLALGMISLAVPACREREEHTHREHHKVVVTSPQARDVTVTQPYVCQIHSQRHIEVCALEGGYLDAISIREGQYVKHGDLMFKVIPRLYQARLDAEMAEVEFAQVEYDNAQLLYKNTDVTGKPIVSQTEVKLYKAKLDKAVAKLNLAKAELNFATIRAPFDGVVDRLLLQQGSLVKEGDVLTTLSDNSVMWVYFNVPEARYLEYRAIQNKTDTSTQLKLPDSRIELVLANGSTFDQPAGDTVTIEGKFNNETGNIAFRADFPNPNGLLRHGQTGTVLIHRLLKNAVVVPQRATFEILDKQYVWVVGEDRVAHQRPITVAHELEDIYVIKGGVGLNDKIVLEGVQQVHENDKLEDAEFLKPGEVLSHQKYRAE